MLPGAFCYIYFGPSWPEVNVRQREQPHCRSPPLSIRFVHLPTQKSNGGQAMKIINLRDYYPFYTQDTLLEISDEVAQAMAEAERLERNYNTLIIKLLFPLRNPIKFDTLRRILQLPDSKLILY